MRYLGRLVAIALVTYGAVANGAETVAPPEKLSLAGAVSRVLEVDEGYKSAREGVVAAEHGVKEARAAFIPSLSGDLSGVYVAGLPQIEIPANAFGPGFPPEPINMSLPGAENVSAGVTLIYLPYQGGREYTGYRLAKRGLDLSREGLRAARADLIYGAVRAYYDVVLAEESVRVADASVAVATSHVIATEDRYDAGLVSEYDVLRARVQLTNLETARRYAEDGRAAATRYLLSLLDQPPETSVALTDRLAFAPEKFNLDESLGKATAERPDLRQLELSRVLAEEGVKMARGGDNPTVVFTTDFKEYAQAFSLDFGNDWSDETTLALSVSWPFFDGFATRARVGKARASLYQTEFAKVRAEEGVDMEVRAAYENLLTLEANARAQEDNVDLAKKGLDIAQARYDAGLMSNLEVLDAQAALTQAELSYYKALRDYEVAKYAFRRSRGELDAMMSQ